VFHDHEKVSTVWIHVLPSWLVYATRWQQTSSIGGGVAAARGHIQDRLLGLDQCDAFSAGDFATSLAFYLLWQVLYFAKTEVLDADFLNENSSIQTSLRWLALDTERPVHQLVLGVSRTLGVMKRDEVFNPYQTKTKLCFMVFQLVYTALTLLPVPLLHRARSLSTTTLIAVFSIATYNGGEYYIEVFSRRYNRQFGASEGGTSAKEEYLVRDEDAEPTLPVEIATLVETPPDGTAAVLGDGSARKDDVKERWALDSMRWEAPPPIVSDDDDDDDDDLSMDQSAELDDVDEVVQGDMETFSPAVPEMRALQGNNNQKRLARSAMRRRRGRGKSTGPNQHDAAAETTKSPLLTKLGV